MPAPRITYTPEEIAWRNTTIELLRSNGASSSPAVAYERTGSMDVNLTRIYLDPKRRLVLDSNLHPITVEDVLTLGHLAII